MTDAAKGFITDGFPAPGLRKAQRLITGHGADGKGRFLVTDNNDHHRVMGEQQAVAVIPYSTNENPVELNEDVHVAFARENEVFSGPRSTISPYANTGATRPPHPLRQRGPPDRLRSRTGIAPPPGHVN
ncbi:MAG: hypothetical protein Q9170_001987 [Blastenia crenularia]